MGHGCRCCRHTAGKDSMCLIRLSQTTAGSLGDSTAASGSIDIMQAHAALAAVDEELNRAVVRSSSIRSHGCKTSQQCVWVPEDAIAPMLKRNNLVAAVACFLRPIHGQHKHFTRTLHAGR